MSSSPRRRSWRALLLSAVLALCPALAQAQTGTLRGTVSGGDGDAVRAAQVTVSGTRLSATTDDQGAFTLTGVPAGPHRIRASRGGYIASTQDVTIRSGEETLVAIRLEPSPVELDGVVVSASRQAERITDAPASITRIGPEVLENAVGNTFAGALREVQGLDYIQVGMTSVAINARGFNSSFNNRMLMMEDGRVSVLPENGLPVGQFTPTPKVDLAGIEVLVGPGSALYGADASSGVISLTTKDPRAFPGTTVEITGGNRNYKDVQLRHAGVVGNFGYKVAGEWQEADDWNNYLAYTNSGVRLREDSLKLPIDWDARVTRGTAALVYYAGDSRFEVTGGASQTDGVGQTNVGRNQLKDWGYNFFQAKFSSPHWYATAYRSQSTSGESFALNRFAAAQSVAANASLTADSLRLLSDWPSDGRMIAAEVQGNYRVPAFLNTAVVGGVQYRRDIVSSHRQWLTDRLTGEDVDNRQVGLYAQTTTPVSSRFDVILAARLDDHESYDRQFSPKAGLVYKPADGQSLRVTYNRAFKSPTILQTHFHIPDWTAVVSIFGNTEGFTVKNPDGTTFATYDPLVPEENQTWELGYKGILNGRLFLDVVGYYSRFENFLSPLVTIADPLGLGLVRPAGERTFAFDGAGQEIKNPAGLSPLVLTYYNLGRATLYGTDVGVNYVWNRHFNLKGTVSLMELKDVEVPENRVEATALNSPVAKWTLGAAVHDIGAFHGGATLRHVTGYQFRSGINAGKIPTFNTLDVNVGYRLPRWRSSINVGVSNLFTCRSNDPTIPDEGAECGFGVKHTEMINMPAIGSMLYVGVKVDTQ
ncbi:MAG TPA: TonB-dependent receptor [Longimicrobium sp.]|nr:TonB-dependent receptor [Longimicrobium sp.]